MFILLALIERHNMQNEDVLIYSSAVLLCALALAATIYNFSSLTHAYSKNQPKHFDKSRIPAYTITNIAAMGILLIYAVLFSHDPKLVSQFVLGNLFFVGVASATILLYKK